MGDYFISRRELDEEREHLFNAMAKCLSDLEKELFLMIEAVLGQKSQTARNKNTGEKRMGEKRSVEEILKELMDYVLKSDDEKLIILADELEESIKTFKEEKEKIQEKLIYFQKRIEGFLESERKTQEKK